MLTNSIDETAASNRYDNSATTIVGYNRPRVEGAHAASALVYLADTKLGILPTSKGKAHSKPTDIQRSHAAAPRHRVGDKLPIRHIRYLKTP